MSNPSNEAIGYACAYTPLALLYAAKYRPYRVLPLTESPDLAGLHLHDNLCPHVKRILDRAIEEAHTMSLSRRYLTLWELWAPPSSPWRGACSRAPQE